MILCDNCGQGRHTYCTGLRDVPEGNYYCPECEYDIINKLLNDEYVDPS